MGSALDGSGASADPAAEVVAEIEAAGGVAIVNGDDVADFAGALRIVEQAVATFGRLDAVVNNAGIVRDRMFANVAEDEWDAVMRVNLKGHFTVSRHAAAHWRDRAKAGEVVDGRIVNTSSGAGILGSIGQAAYSTAKGGIAALTLVQAAELGRYGVTANALAPAARTRMTEGVFTDMMAAVDDGAFDVMDPANVSPLVAWLVSSGQRRRDGQDVRDRRRQARRRRRVAARTDGRQGREVGCRGAWRGRARSARGGARARAGLRRWLTDGRDLSHWASMSEVQLQEPLVAPPRPLRNLVVAVVVAALVSGWIGAALAPTLVVRHPLWLISLNANNRYLILSTNQLDGFSFYAVALARRVVPTLAFFLLGYWYGERAVNWLEHREPDSGQGIRFVERLFQRSGWLVVAIAPMTITALLAGAARLRPSRLVPLVVVSIAARLVLLRQLGQAFSGPVDAVVRWIDRTRRPLLVLSIGSVALIIWLQRRQRRESLEELTALDDDLE